MQRLRGRARIVARLGVSLAAASCGGDSNDGAGCGPFTPCGGDPTGVWQAQSVCSEIAVEDVLAAQGLPPECGDALRITEVRQVGTLSLGAGSYDENVDFTIVWDLRFDLTCVNALAEAPVPAAQIPAFCDGFQEQIRSDPESPFTDMTCRVAGDACLCDALQNELVASVGTLQIGGNNLLFEAGDDRQFCASGDELVLETADPMIGLFQVTYARAMR